MRFDYFSVAGYLSFVLWIAVPALLALHFRARSRRWLCHFALGLALAAYFLAKVNSLTYVNRIQLDQSAEIAATQAKLDAARKAAEDARGSDVAQIKFAEDSAGDYLDKAGMNEADLKYIEKVAGDTEPEWKKTRKERSKGKKEDNSVEALIGAKQETKGVETKVAAVSEESRPIMMVEKDKMLANRLDAANLFLVRFILLSAILAVVIDYLRRANVYEEAYLPLPLPGGLLNSLVPVPPVVKRPSPARRSVPEELGWITRRGEVFIYMTDKPESAAAMPASLARIGKRILPVDLIRVGKDDAVMTDQFIFEALWYGRSSFVVESVERSSQILGWFAEYMKQRKATRARAARVFHIVWDMNAPLDEAWQAAFARLARETGASLFIC